tara:strand:+ start:80 stop:508 length:429 start_codon:yes stop_codon:yes gene_type:complete
MDIRHKYRLYWRKFSGYKGNNMGYKDSFGNWHYGNFDLYKFGYERVGKDRVKMNELLEKKDRWVDLWSDIETVDYADFLVTRSKIKEIEKYTFSIMGEKDFWMEEKPSGIREFMLATNSRKNKAHELFEYLKEKQNISPVEQ